MQVPQLKASIMKKESNVVTALNVSGTDKTHRKALYGASFQLYMHNGTIIFKDGIYEAMGYYPHCTS